jgi:hypothetical protein
MTEAVTKVLNKYFQTWTVTRLGGDYGLRIPQDCSLEKLKDFSNELAEVLEQEKKSGIPFPPTFYVKTLERASE